MPSKFGEVFGISLVVAGTCLVGGVLLVFMLAFGALAVLRSYDDSEVVKRYVSPDGQLAFVMLESGGGVLAPLYHHLTLVRAGEKPRLNGSVFGTRNIGESQIDVKWQSNDSVTVTHTDEKAYRAEPVAVTTDAQGKRRTVHITYKLVSYAVFEHAKSQRTGKDAKPEQTSRRQGR